MTLSAGAASRDITPELRGDFFGYVRPDLRARGVALRLFAHALVLDDGVRRIALLTLDLGAPLVTDRILERLAPHGYDVSNLLIAATHTHAGPNKPGAFVADQAVAAVLVADAARRPARAAWTEAAITEANHNRSLEAHLANHGLDLCPGTGTPELDPLGPDHPRDTTLRLLRVDDLEGAPLAAWAHFSAHPTTFGPANTYFSADYPRAAAVHFRDGFAGTGPIAIVTNGTEGDLIPRCDDVNQHALADLIGRRVAGAMRRAWHAAAEPADVTVAGTSRHIVYEGQRLAPGKRVGRRAWFGVPFLGGAQNGPSWFYGLGLEGRRRPRWLAGRVQGRKLLAAPAPHPNHTEVTALRIGNHLLLGVPGEPSVEAGRRMCLAALAAAPEGVDDALIVGLAQRYRGYFTTPEEYDQQHYEGGHTVFGRHTSLLVETTHAELAARLSGPETSTGQPQVTEDGLDPARSLPRASSAASAGTGARRLRVVQQPPSRVARFDVVTVAWRGAVRGHDRPVDTPFLVLQRGESDWQDVDDDLGLGFVWRQVGRRAVARYEVAADLSPGRYRIEIRGRRTTAPTRPFEVVPSDGLRLLGVHRGNGGLCFTGQNPPPNPVRHLRSRPRAPRGGTVTFLAAGAEHRADWAEEAGGWVAVLDEIPPTVHVPAGGLRDIAGNRSGAAVELRVGEVANVAWPPAIGPGGGRAPGPLGLGSTGRPAPWPPPSRGPR